MTEDVGVSYTVTPMPATSPKRERPIVGVVVTVIVTAVSLPVSWFLGFFLLIAASRYDSSGSGGPYRSCLPDSASCSDPNYGLAVACGAAILLLCFVAGLAGQRAGKLRPAKPKVLVLSLLSAALTFAGVAASFSL